MSEFSLPATVSERQEARRHGRPPHRGKRRPAGTRSYHLYLSLVPSGLMALLGVAAVTDLLTVGTSSAVGRLVLVVIAALAVVVMGAAAFGADAATRRERIAYGRRSTSVPISGTVSPPEDTQRRLGELGYLLSHGRQELQGLRERLAAGETPPPRGGDTRLGADNDAYGQLAQEIRAAQTEAWNALVSVASARGGTTAQRVEVFVNLARRMQTLSHRAIQGLDELENQVEDPDLLKGLFRVDHLSTRMRRQAESLAVIGGAASRRQWSRPVTVYEVLRSAIAEVEHYNRVKVVPPVEGTLEGGAVADVIHLLAELIENATKFAPPHTQVLIRAEPVTAGLAIEVEDRGLGIPREDQRRINDLLADLERIDVDEFLQDGRIGLLVVAALSRRHHIAVRLNTNLYGGTQAVIVVPAVLLGAEHQETPQLETVPEPVPALSAGAPGPSSASFSGSVHGASYGSVPIDPAPATAPFPQQPTGYEPAGYEAAGYDPAGYEPAAFAGEPTPRADHTPAASARPPAPRTDAAPGQRPQLPRRRAQQNLAPELRQAPAHREDDDTDAGHNPGLMAAFQQGMRIGQEDEEPTDRPGGTG